MWFASWLAGPSYEMTASLARWLDVLLFSASLLSLAVALLIFGRMVGGPQVVRLATIAAAVLVAAATALVPSARRSSPFGVAAIGFALTGASVVAGASVASTVVVLLGWAVAGGSTIALRRVS